MVTSFPFANGLIETCFEVFRGSSKTLLQFVPLIFIGRIILIKMTFGGSHDYRELLKELMYLYIGFFAFQEVMEFVMSTPEMAAQIIKKPKQLDIKEKSSWILNLFKFDMEDFINMVSSGVYWFVCFCYLILMGFMITVGAYIIFFSSLLKMKWMIKAYMSLVLILSLWPFIWYTVDQTFVFVIEGLKNSNSGTGVIIAKVISALLKIFVPILGIFAAMKAPVAGAISAFNSMKEGSKPAAGAAKASYKGAKNVGKALGFDTAVESFRKDPETRESKRQDKIANRKFHMNDVAPMAAYGARKAFNRLPSSEKQKTDAYGQTQLSQKKMGYREFKENNVINLEKRKNFRSQHKINEKTNYNNNSKISGFNESRIFNKNDTTKSEKYTVNHSTHIDKLSKNRELSKHNSFKEKNNYKKSTNTTHSVTTYTQKTKNGFKDDYRGKES